MSLLSIPIFCSCFLFSFLFLLFPICFYLIIIDRVVVVEWIFFSSSVSPMVLTFVVDLYGVLFSCVVLFISSNVLVFSHSYMRGDLFIGRFIYMVLLFVLSMNFLVFIPNLIALLIG